MTFVQPTLFENWKKIMAIEISCWTDNQALINRASAFFYSRTESQPEIEILLNDSGKAIDFKEISNAS